jgi:deoxyadenosine/deoxycytidine kinase
MMKPIIVSLEGNIGAGKSSILAALETTLCVSPIPGQTWVFLKEPLHLWEQIKDADGNTMLSKFYSNPAKYSFAFQIMAFTTRLKMLRQIIRDHPGITGIVCERSLDADQQIFAKMLHDDGLMEDVEYEIYRQYFDLYDSEFHVDGIIYLDTNPDTCYRRVSMRSREGEAGISLEYLRKCGEYHDLWLRSGTDRLERPIGRLERPIGRPRSGTDRPERPIGRLERSGTDRPEYLLRIDTSLDASFTPIDQQGQLWLNQIIGFLHDITDDYV